MPSLKALLTDSVVDRFLTYPRKPFTFGANRVALTIKLDRDILPGLFACHTCDNPPCCNPDHLYEGTHQQNVDDKVRRNRQQKGEDVRVSVLTAPAVREIRERFAGGEMITNLAVEFAVSLGAVSKLLNGKTWTHVGGPIRRNGHSGRRTDRERAGQV
jgi:hypothetical protein